MDGESGFLINRFGEEFSYSILKTQINDNDSKSSTVGGVTTEQLSKTVTLLKTQFSDTAKQTFKQNMKKWEEKLEESLKINDKATKNEIDKLGKSVKPCIMLAKSIEPISAPSSGGLKDSLQIKDQRRISQVSRGVLVDDVVIKSQLDELKEIVDKRFNDLSKWKEQVASDFTELHNQVTENRRMLASELMNEVLD